MCVQQLPQSSRTIQGRKPFKEDNGRLRCVAGASAERQGKPVRLELLLAAERTIKQEAESESCEQVRRPQQSRERVGARSGERMPEMNVGGFVGQDEGNLVTLVAAEFHQ
jgi:hypothetical protein